MQKQVAAVSKFEINGETRGVATCVAQLCSKPILNQVFTAQAHSRKKPEEAT